MTASLKLNCQKWCNQPHIHSQGCATREERGCQTYSVIETRMVGLREGHHKLPCTLVARVDFHAGFLEATRVHESHQLEEQVRLGFEQVWGFSAYRRFEFLRVIPWNAVPRLRLPPMHCGAGVE